jgi:hypothetical protein
MDINIKKDALKRAFAKAGLVLTYADAPFARGENAQDIFGLDIRRDLTGNRRDEVFRIWWGHPDNELQVMSVDKDIAQIVFQVREPARTFTDTLPTWAVRAHKATEADFNLMLASNRIRPRDVVEKDLDRDYVLVRRKTSAATRHYLMGRDERQLFIAELKSAASTVKQAHDNLKSVEVTFAEGRAPGKTIRQGEWFLVNPTPDELHLLEEGIKNRRLIVATKVDIRGAMGGDVSGRWRRSTRPDRRSGGNPHVADELVTLPPKLLEHGFSVRNRTEVYVRGAIRHVDHRTVKVKTWRRVIRNNEGNTTGGLGGGSWVD